MAGSGTDAANSDCYSRNLLLAAQVTLPTEQGGKYIGCYQDDPLNADMPYVGLAITTYK